MKCLAILVFFLSLFIGLDRFFHPKDSKFAVRKISVDWSEKPAPSLEAPPQIFDQTFTYFNKGSQSYVFLSENKQYVIKFFKQHKLRPTTWLSLLPFSSNPFYKDACLRKQKKDAVFSSTKLAYETLKEETALVYLHLSPTNDIKKEILCIDKRGKKHRISLDNTIFFVQKKADPLYPTIDNLMKEGKVEEAKTTLASLFSLLRSLGEKGIYDNDPILRKNFAFLEGRAVQIDIGKMKMDPTKKSPLIEEAYNITKSLRAWIEINQPELSSFAEEELVRLMEK